MTSHEFAQQLLAGPDLPIWHPSVLEYDPDDEPPLHEPAVSHATAFNNVLMDEEGVLIISYKP